MMTKGLLDLRNCLRFRNRLRCYCGAIGNSGNRVVQVADRQVGIPARHGEPFVPEQLRDVPERYTRLAQTRCEAVPQVMPSEILDSSGPHGGRKPMRVITENLP